MPVIRTAYLGVGNFFVGMKEFAMKEFMKVVRSFVERMVRQNAQHKCPRRVLQSQSFPEMPFRTLCVKTVALDVRFETANDDVFLLSIETEDLRDIPENVSFMAAFDGQKLSVCSSEKRFHGAELIAHLPQGWEVVEVSTKNGDVSITDCNIKQITIVTVSADISVNGVICDDIKLSSQNGDVTALNIESKNKIQATSVNGDVVR